MHTDDSVTNQSGWGFTVKQGVTTIHEDSAAYMVSTSSVTVVVQAVTHALRWTASWDDIDSQTTHAISSSHSQWTYNKMWKVEWEAKSGMCQWLTSTFENSWGNIALDMVAWREMTKQIDWWVKQSSQMASVLEYM